MLDEFAPFADFNRLSHFSQAGKTQSPHMVVVQLIGLNERKQKIQEFPWLGDSGLKRLIEDLGIIHTNAVLFIGTGELEHDPQNYSNLENALAMCINSHVSVGIVSYATALDLTDTMLDYCEVLIPGLTIEDWHKVMGGEPITDKRRSWNYPWDHKDPSCILVGRTTEGAKIPAKGVEILNAMRAHGCKSYHKIRKGPENFTVDTDLLGSECHFQWFRPAIDFTGQIFPCPATMASRSLGNLSFTRFKEWCKARNKVSVQSCPRVAAGEKCFYGRQNLAVKGASQRGNFI